VLFFPSALFIIYLYFILFTIFNFYIRLVLLFHKCTSFFPWYFPSKQTRVSFHFHLFQTTKIILPLSTIFPSFFFLYFDFLSSHVFFQTKHNVSSHLIRNPLPYRFGYAVRNLERIWYAGGIFSRYPISVRGTF
jgi:hypothetical protein